MNENEHKERHIELHRALDELIADFFIHDPSLPSVDASVMSLIEWSHLQTIQPTHTEEVE